MTRSLLGRLQSVRLARAGISVALLLPLAGLRGLSPERPTRHNPPMRGGRALGWALAMTLLSGGTSACTAQETPATSQSRAAATGGATPGTGDATSAAGPSSPAPGVELDPGEDAVVQVADDWRMTLPARSVTASATAPPRLLVEADSGVAAAEAPGEPLADPVDLVLRGGDLSGVGRTELALPEPLPEGRVPSYGTWDPEGQAWRPQQAALSDDRRKVSADVSHLSVHGFFAHEAGSFFGTRASEPDCPGDRPAWVDELVEVEDRDAPLLSCVEADSGRPELAVVRVVNNRGFGVLVVPAVTPERRTLRGLDDAWLRDRVVAAGDSLLSGVGAVAATGRRGVFLAPGQEVAYRFTREQVAAARGGVLVQATPTSAAVVLGLALTAFQDVAGADRRWAPLVASVLTRECGVDLVVAGARLEASGYGEAVGVAGRLAQCVVTQRDAIERALVEALQQGGVRGAEALRGRLAKALKRVGYVLGIGDAFWKAADLAASLALAESAYALSLTVKPQVTQGQRVTLRGLVLDAPRSWTVRRRGDPTLVLTYSTDPTFQAEEFFYYALQLVGPAGLATGGSGGPWRAGQPYRPQPGQGGCPVANFQVEQGEPRLVAGPRPATVGGRAAVYTEFAGRCEGADYRQRLWYLEAEQLLVVADDAGEESPGDVAGEDEGDPVATVLARATWG